MAADGHLGYTKMAAILRNRFADRRDVCFWGQVFGIRQSNGTAFNDLE